MDVESLLEFSVAGPTNWSVALAMFGLSKRSISQGAVLVAALLLMTATPVRAETAQSDPVVVILFMFFGLGTGILIMQVLSALGDPIPYTCVVFASGIIFSLAHKSNTGKRQRTTSFTSVL